MAEFKSWQSFWHFENTVMRRRRYVRDGEAKQFLETVRQTAAHRIDVLSLATDLWRAQLGNDWKSSDHCDADFPTLVRDDEVMTEVQSSTFDHPCLPGPPFPYDAVRMKPQSERAIEGRVNPKGIPCLYLATDCKTAIGEVRPWVGAYVSVGLFQTRRQLKLVNCGAGPLLSIRVGKEPPVDQREELVWKCIGDAFARPVTPNDSVADYAATQTIAELFRMDGYDGISYRSSLGDGRNIALFDVDAADMTEAHLFRIKNVRLDSEEAGESEGRTYTWWLH